MGRSIMDQMQEHLNPVSVSNAIYEMMLDWRTAVMMHSAGVRNAERKRHKLHRQTSEKYLALFFGVHPQEMNQMLRKHFGLEDVHDYRR